MRPSPSLPPRLSTAAHPEQAAVGAASRSAQRPAGRHPPGRRRPPSGGLALFGTAHPLPVSEPEGPSTSETTSGWGAAPHAATGGLAHLIQGRDRPPRETSAVQLVLHAGDVSRRAHDPTAAVLGAIPRRAKRPKTSTTMARMRERCRGSAGSRGPLLGWGVSSDRCSSPRVVSPQQNGMTRASSTAQAGRPNPTNTLSTRPGTARTPTPAAQCASSRTASGATPDARQRAPARRARAAE